MAPDVLGWNANFSATVSSATAISRVTLVRTGAVTHAFHNNQRFYDLQVVGQSGSTLNLRTPASANVAPPGSYMMVVFNADGLPAVAKILRLG